jgi:hypothetical protein
MSSVAFGRPYVTPADFGARGDGTTDDRAAIQAAIDQCGGTLFIPRLAGDYMLSDVLQLPSNITLIGIGNPCLKLLPNRPFRTQLEPPTTPNYNAVITNADHVNGNHHIRLFGLKLDGNLGNPANPNQIVEQGGRGANLVVVLWNQVSFFEIADCELTGGISECIYALGGCASPWFGSTHGIISNCFIHDTGQPDVDSLGCHGDRVDGVSVSGCTFQNIGLRAIGFSYGTNVAVSGCTAINCQDGILLGGTRHASFAGCTFVDVRNDGMLIDQAPDGTVPLNVNVAGCTFVAKAGNTGYGVRLKKGNFCNVSAVTAQGFLRDGFLVESGENTLDSVIAANCSGYGIHLNGAGAIHNSVGPYHAFACAGEDLEDGDAGDNRWFGKSTRVDGLYIGCPADPAYKVKVLGDCWLNGDNWVNRLAINTPVDALYRLKLLGDTYLDGNVTVTGLLSLPLTLGVGQGGTGADNAAGARWMLDVYSKGEVDALLAGRASSSHTHQFDVPGHAHGGVTVGTGTSGTAGGYSGETSGPEEP